MNSTSPSTFHPTRRGLLRGDPYGHGVAIRAPWSQAEPLFIDACLRLHHCIDACPEKILIRGDGGYPRIDFQLGECTFCGACARACPSPAFRAMDEIPWALRARVGDACLTRQNVVCRSCGDHCEVEAIRFTPRLGAVAEPFVDAAICNGCGACVASCPTRALTVTASKSQE